MYNKSTSTNRLHRDTSSPKCTIRLRVQTKYIQIPVVLVHRLRSRKEYIQVQVVIYVQLDYE